MKKFISLAVSLSLLSGGFAYNPAASTSAAAAGENKIYVSLSGSDSADGTIITKRNMQKMRKKP